MDDETLDLEIIETAKDIGLPVSVEELFDAQMVFWTSLQAIMRDGGYMAVRKRMPFVSEELAKGILNASFKSLIGLCSSEISTIRPCLPDSQILETLASSNDELSRIKMALRILAECKTRSSI